ncbi:unannotated protein [freshwater metagenome]|uniref:Unannotated protein n=1 Tax=freshwater metagenome TaxID=449393 RepID=A0A6J6J9V9_9ZZZZ
MFGHRYCDLIDRNEGHLQKESFDISVIDVHEVLEEGIRRGALRREPHRTIDRLAELLPVGTGHEWNGQTVDMCSFGAANEINASGDISPLV